MPRAWLWGSPHDIEHRHFIWSDGARTCDWDRLAAVPIADNQREYDIQHRLLDIVAHTMMITCGRLRREDFSSVCFDERQRVLVLRNSKAHSLADLRGQKVCSTSGATSIAKIVAANAILVPVTYWTDYLMLLQQGDVAAISTDDCILKGLESLDPRTELRGAPVTNEPYGLAINNHPDFVGSVNAVLEQLRTDGQWSASYAHWTGTPAPAAEHRS